MENLQNEDKLNKYIEEMKDLYNTLLSFLEDSGELEEDCNNFNELKKILNEQEILQEKEKYRSFLILILNICNNHHRSPIFITKIERIFQYLSRTINDTFTNKQLFDIFSGNKLILLYLFQEKIITINKSIYKCFSEEDDKKYCHFFYPEIKQFLSEEKLNEIQKELLKEDPDYRINFHINRKQGENEKYLCKLIREDKVEEFISYINFAHIPLCLSIKPSIYETNTFLIDKSPTLIEYAAFFGSIHIFLYLVFNQVDINEQIWIYAIHSNCAELIHHLESYDIFRNDQTMKKIYLESIKCHHNDLCEYIGSNLLNLQNEKSNEETDYKEKIISKILKYHKYLYFPKEIEQNFTFFYLTKYKYFKIITLFLKTIKIEEGKLSNKKLLRKSANENKIHIIYYLLSKQNQINNKTFEKCKELKKLSIPPTIKVIGEYSFSECTSLTEICIPSSVKIIERCAFYECSSLKKIKIPKSVKFIGSHSFRECSSLQEINIPSSVKCINSHTFDRCIQLRKISLPKSIRTIGTCAFYECSSLNCISLPLSIKIIESHAFHGCISLIEIDIPNSVKQICKGSMKLCISLLKISIPSATKIINSYLFYGCSSLTQITIPSSVTSIGDSAFSECSSLTQITIPSSVTSIGKYAFYGCSSLTQITIPSSVTSIGDSAFSEYSSLTQITIPSSVTSFGKNTFNECSSLTQITIPSSVTEIGDNAFSRCSSLTQITIPSSVTEIGDNDFSRCSSVTQITVPYYAPSVRKSVFEGCSSLSLIPQNCQVILNAFNSQELMKNLKIIERVSSEKIEDNLNTFYKVLLVEDIETSKKYLAKVFYVFFDYYPPKLLEKIYNSIINTLIIKFPSILEYSYFSKDGFSSEDRPTLFTEFVENSTLEDVILSQNSEFDATKKLINIYGIASAMKYLHSINILHLDLTLENIIEDSNFYPKIKDFGMSGIFKDINSVMRINKNNFYLAPECYMSNEYDEKCEVFSFSLIVYQIMMNKIQFKGINIINHIDNIIQNKRPEFDDKIPEAYIDLIKKCWASDPKERPTFEMIVDEIEKNPKFITKDVNNGEFKKYTQLFKTGQKQVRKENHGSSDDDNDDIGKEEEERKTEPDNDDEKERKENPDNDDEKERKTGPDNDDIDEEEEEEERKAEPDNEVEEEEEEEEGKVDPDNDDEKERKVEPDNNDGDRKIELDNDDDNNEDNIEEEEGNAGPDNDENLKRIPIEVPSLQKDHIININEYKKGEQIGKGGTSIVYKAIKINQESIIYAAKVFSLVINDYEKIKSNVAHEIEYQVKLTDSSFPKFIGYSPVSFNQRKNPLTMIEFLNNGSLSDAVKRLSKGEDIPELNEERILEIITNIASAMNSLHSKGLIHRDLKLENILLDDSYNPKLSDFGLLMKVSEKLDEVGTVGTGPYIAPEIWKSKNYSEASDVYAFGILVSELVTKKLFFRDKTTDQIMYMIVFSKKRPELDGNVSEFYKKLITSCWDEDPLQRPTFAKIIEDILNQIQHE